MEFIASALPLTIGAAEWQAPIDSVGTKDFDVQLMRSLQDWAGVEHHASFIMASGETRLLTADAGIQGHCELASAARAAAQAASQRPHRAGESGGGAVLFRIEPATPCDGVFVCDEREGVSYGLALMRTLHQGRFTDTELDCLRSVAGTWLSLLSKHQRLMAAKRQIDAGSALLGSVQEIEEKLQRMMPSLSRAGRRRSVHACCAACPPQVSPWT